MTAAHSWLLTLCLAAILATADGHRSRWRMCQIRRGKEPRLLHSSPVQVEILYEALCPFCKSYLTGQVARAMRSELGKFVHLHLYPYGNATEKDGIVECQHGVEECRLNTLSACGIKKLHGKPESRLAFIECVEQLASTADGRWRDCLSATGNQKGNIAACFQGDEGAALLKSIGKFSRRQSYNYVPWVIVNGKHKTSSEANFTFAVCEELGDRRPHICSTLSAVGVGSFLEETQRCFKEASLPR